MLFLGSAENYPTSPDLTCALWQPIQELVVSKHEEGTEDLRILFEGNVAVITCRAWSKAPDQKEPPKERVGVSEVWVERNDRWTVLHLHFHQIAPSQDQTK
jgi:hypothetical protein